MSDGIDYRAGWSAAFANSREAFWQRKLSLIQSENDFLREALEQYADARHWGIERDEYRHPRAVWIGPGADQRMPDGPGIARAALSASPPVQEQA